MLNHLRRNVVSYLALFVALGGTGYAATQLPANSVGTKQLRNKAVTPAKVSRAAVKLFKGQRGARGLGGPRGAQGSQGIQGPKGDKGDVGPTSASATSDALAPTVYTHVAATTTVTMPAAGKLFAYGREFVEFTCTAAGHCGVNMALFLDGNYVHGSSSEAVGDNSQFVGTSIAPMAIASGVSAGAHTLELRTYTAGSNIASVIEFATPPPQVGGIALGG